MAVLPLLADEEEHLLLLLIPAVRDVYRTSKCVAEIVESKRIDLFREKGTRVEHIVSNELKQRSVKLPATAAGDDVNQRSRTAAKLSTVAGGQDLDLGDCVGTGI